MAGSLTYRASHTRQTAFEEGELGFVGRQLDGAFVRPCGLLVAAEAAEEIGAGGMEEVHLVERRLELVDQRKTGLRAFGHRDGDGAVERDHWGWIDLNQFAVQRCDLRPVGGCRSR